MIKNCIISKAVKRLKIPYREKEKLYILIAILGELVLYKDSIVNLKTKLVLVSVKG